MLSASKLTLRRLWVLQPVLQTTSKVKTVLEFVDEEEHDLIKVKWEA